MNLAAAEKHNCFFISIFVSKRDTLVVGSFKIFLLFRVRVILWSYRHQLVMTSL